MVIENIMYFALGLLVAGLVSLIILPAVWKRAVRLTKRRIEAATPITMAEFRADKDQLRAEFALTTRKLEINVETLRKRLAEQLSDVNQGRSDLGQLRVEREQYLQTVKELESREAELRARTAELEREGTDLAQRLRMRERELETRTEELRALRDTPHQPAAAAPVDDDEAESDDLVAAEASMASAENRINALLHEKLEHADHAQPERSLAEELSLEDEVEQLRRKVKSVEQTIISDWGSDLDAAELRQRLGDIASNASRVVYAVDIEKPAPAPIEESLFDRVQRFADDGMSVDTLPPPKKSAGRRAGSVTDRMAALREIQGR